MLHLSAKWQLPLPGDSHLSPAVPIFPLFYFQVYIYILLQLPVLLCLFPEQLFNSIRPFKQIIFQAFALCLSHAYQESRAWLKLHKEDSRFSPHLLRVFHFQNIREFCYERYGYIIFQSVLSLKYSTLLIYVFASPSSIKIFFESSLNLHS